MFKFQLMTLSFLIISCGYEVEKRFIPEYERLFNEGLHKESIYQICIEAEKGENLPELENWLNANYNALNSEYQGGEIESIEDFSANVLEDAMDHINELIYKRTLLIAKENKKDVDNLSQDQKEELEVFNKLLYEKRKEKQEHKDKIYYYKKELKKLDDLVKILQDELLEIKDDEAKVLVLKEKIKYYEENILKCKNAISSYKKLIQDIGNDISKINKEKHLFLVQNGAAPDGDKINQLNMEIEVLKTERISTFQNYVYKRVLLTINSDTEIFSFSKLVKKYLTRGIIRRLVIF
jgi:hypothetical protein